jgi:hypothetical protein
MRDLKPVTRDDTEHGVEYVKLSDVIAEREADRREVENLRARLDRAIKAAEEHFGEDAIRYKLSLFKNGRASNYFPQEFDGRWFAFQRADNDAHVGLCDRINQLESEREADRALMREALDVIVFLYGRTARYDTDVVSAISKLRARVG